jgi:hypothetical protein
VGSCGAMFDQPNWLSPQRSKRWRRLVPQTSCRPSSERECGAGHSRDARLQLNLQLCLTGLEVHMRNFIVVLALALAIVGTTVYLAGDITASTAVAEPCSGSSC